MNQIKRWLGILWILLGPLAIYYLNQNGCSRNKTETGAGYKDSVERVCNCIHSNRYRNCDLRLVCAQG